MQGGDVWKAVIGDYDYKYLCTPVLWKSKGRKAPPFFGVDQQLAFLVAVVMGLQHALAMTGGVVTPPLLIGFKTADADTRQYLISASLIVSGIMTIVQVKQFKFRGFALGTGLISVMGTSFTFLPTAQNSIDLQKEEDGATFDEAYGKFIGTVLVCALLEVALSFLPPALLKRMFPPLVSGVTITLIGVSLTGTGIRYWGGGVACANGVFPTCGGNGEVALPYGSPEYIGLGLIVLVTLIIIELFGSPFMRNAGIVISLLMAYFVSALVTKDGKRYVDSDNLDKAPWLTFLWVETFPLGFYGPAVIPLLIAFVVTSVESIGDITASAEASRVDPSGPEHDMRIQGGLLADGLASMFASLGTSMPNTTFSQNNGVIVLTRTASRSAGYACACFLILFGVVAKFGAFITTIPDCVLGGMTTFLFANVMVSGIKVITRNKVTRRDTLILAVSLGLGVGVSIIPGFANNNLWPVTDDMSTGVKGIRDGIILTLETGYAIGAIAAMILNTILPKEEESRDGLEQTEKDSTVV